MNNVFRGCRRKESIIKGWVSIWVVRVGWEVGGGFGVVRISSCRVLDDILCLKWWDI